MTFDMAASQSGNRAMPTASLYLTLGDVERFKFNVTQISKSYLIRSWVRPSVTIKHQLEITYGESNFTITLDIEWPWKTKVTSLRVWRHISRKGAELGPMLLLSIYRKQYMGSPMAPSHLTLRNLERSKQRSLRFGSLISRKSAQLGPMLLLNIDRKPYMMSPMAPSHLALSDLERSKSRSRRFLSLISCKGA